MKEYLGRVVVSSSLNGTTTWPKSKFATIYLDTVLQITVFSVPVCLASMSTPSIQLYSGILGLLAPSDLACSILFVGYVSSCWDDMFCPSENVRVVFNTLHMCICTIHLYNSLLCLHLQTPFSCTLHNHFSIM